MKVAGSNLSAESFGHLMYMICANRKTAIADLPPTSAAIQGHLLQAHYFTNISLNIIDTTKSTLQPLNFCLCEIPNKFIIKSAYKTNCGNCYACKKHEHKCVEY